MIFHRLLAATLATATLWSAGRSQIVPRIEAVEALQPRTPDVPTENYAVLTRGPGKSKSSAYLHGLLKGGCHGDKALGVAKLFPIEGVSLYANVTIDGQEFSLIVDTGSDMSWVPLANVVCVDKNDTVVGHGVADCGFGSALQGTPSGGMVPHDNFSLYYGDGSYVKGPTGLVDFTVANITVKNQYIGLANKSFWDGDGSSSGLVGLSYPHVKRTPHGLKGPDDKNNTLLTNMMEQDARLTSFSLSATTRFNASAEGYLAFGGLPPVRFVPPFASAPMQKMSIFNATEDYYSYGFFFYTVLPDAYVYDGYHRPTYNGSLYEYTRGPEGKEAAVILDTGTPLSYLPEGVATNVSRLFHPPAILAKDDYFYTLCNATIPRFGVEVGGGTFWISEENMYDEDLGEARVESMADFWLRDRLPPAEHYFINSTTMEVTVVDDTNRHSKQTQYCILGVQPQPFDPNGTLYVLGNSFLNNVVGVFDVGAGELRFANLAQ